MCSSELEPIGRQQRCDHCQADVRVCYNCTFFDPSSYNECREPMSERVLAKDRSNLCDYFQLRGYQKSGEPEETSADRARKAAEALFKK